MIQSAVSWIMRARWRWISVLAMVAAMVAALVANYSTVYHVSYEFYRTHVPFEAKVWGRYLAFIVLVLFVQARPVRIGRLPIIKAEWWSRLDAVAARLIVGTVPKGLVAAIVVLLSVWLPHFLIWPWWTDTDHFALIAQSWDAGIRPYSDLRDYNFPGPTYLQWLIGKTFGWGKTTPVYAVDAAMLGLHGVAMSAWSRARFGHALPGLVGYAIFFSYYLGLRIHMVAQREWQSMFLIVLGLMVLETLRGRRAWLVACFLMAVALTFRPYGVLFLPAYLSALDDGVRGPNEPPSRLLGPLLFCIAGLAAMLALVYSPLVIAGVADDFVRSLSYVLPGGSYNQSNSSLIRARLIENILGWRSFCFFVPLVVLAACTRGKVSRSARTWAFAFAGAIVYKPIGPFQHQYLNIPIEIISSVGVSVIAAWVLANPGLFPLARLLLVITTLDLLTPKIPSNCSPRQSYWAARYFLTGTPPPQAPPGADGYFLPRGKKAGEYDGKYDWESYREMIDHLRRSTTPRTRIANMLRRTPFPAINGVVGRLTPYPAAGGMLWFYWVGLGDEDDFVARLEMARDAVVVWVPDEVPEKDDLELPSLVAVVKKFYRPEARFGPIEVWRRTPEPAPPRIPPNSR